MPETDTEALIERLRVLHTPKLASTASYQSTGLSPARPLPQAVYAAFSSRDEDADPAGCVCPLLLSPQSVWWWRDAKSLRSFLAGLSTRTSAA